jgi:predicted 3-demethylubiquinone-9 3-methyltransferase (glyoxalase superfamily)
MQRVVPCLWFDSEAEEAAKFYIQVFGNGFVRMVV